MTYDEAKQAANKTAPNQVFCGDAGNNCSFEVYFCPFRKRQIWITITPNGIRVV